MMAAKAQYWLFNATPKTGLHADELIVTGRSRPIWRRFLPRPMVARGEALENGVIYLAVRCTT